MSAFISEPAYCHASPAPVGVLVTNVGTPDAPTSSAVRRYLAEFLWDPRVIELPRPLWWLILHGVVLRLRPARSAAAYQKIWTTAGSPLLLNTQAQAKELSEALTERLEAPVEVVAAMRYGNPSIESGLEALRTAGARRILVLPLYPQYAGATTGSTFDAVAAVLKRWRWLPDLCFVSHYHDHPGYIEALVESVRDAWRDRARPQRLLFSFHGIPKRYFLNGDPYHCECQKTARLVAERLGLPDQSWAIAFQSRVGREEWLKPYTDETLQGWAGAGVSSVDVLCPGFSADCLETLEEIDQQYRALFLGAGGESFSYIPALNARSTHIRALADLVVERLRGWPSAPTQTELESRAARARAGGAHR